jgi:hypothetical protein
MFGSRWAEQFQNHMNGTSLNFNGDDGLGTIDGDFVQSQIGIGKDFVSNVSFHINNNSFYFVLK